jgi:hypothetical protein
LDESVDADIAAIEEELAQLSRKPVAPADAPQKPKRAPLPANLPRTDIHHEPESTVCGCGCTLKRIRETWRRNWTTFQACSRSNAISVANGYAEMRDLDPGAGSGPCNRPAQRQKVPDGSAIAKALDYSLKRRVALTRYLEDGDVPIDNNWVENQIRPWAVGRSTWLFAGSLRAGQRAAVVMSLVRSAQLNGLDPHAYLKDVLQRLPTQRDSAIGELLPHR